MFKNLLALIGLAFVLFIIVGKVMGWYTYTRQDGKLTFLIFTDKVEEGLQGFKDSAVKALTKPEDTAKPKQEDTGLRSIFGPLVQPKPQPNGSPASLQLPGQ